MGLGNNRDYKSHGKRVGDTLKLHAALMKLYTDVGWTKESASQYAIEDLKELTTEQRKALLRGETVSIRVGFERDANAKTSL